MNGFFEEAQKQGDSGLAVGTDRRAVRNELTGRLARRSSPTNNPIIGVQPLALVGSSGFLEIAVNNGNAAQELALKIGDVVEVR